MHKQVIVNASKAETGCVKDIQPTSAALQMNTLNLKSKFEKKGCGCGATYSAEDYGARGPWIDSQLYD